MRIKPRFFSIFVIVSAIVLLAACSVNVKKNGEGQDQNVDINTPFGGIHVNQNVDVRDTGLPVYPGARPKQKSGSGEEKSANVNISGGGYGLRVVAVEYESGDEPGKVVAYYLDQLKKFGSVLQCHTSRHGTHYGRSHDHGNSDQLKCEGDNSGKTIELKAGTESNQHIVSIEPRGNGSDFALVYVRTHGKEDSI